MLKWKNPFKIMKFLEVYYALEWKILIYDLHFPRVADSPDCRMPLENLAKVFGPTIVGYSSADPSDSNLLAETRQQCQVMHRLLMLPTDSWGSFLTVELPEVFSRPEIKTPDLTPVPVVSRLGPIYTSGQKPSGAHVGRIPLTPRNTKHSKNGRRFFSPLK
ncbi:unnamed protein product [Larinioides sclopetarius]|uniref:Uncharacterized protein n=1 Tax=Larinioides sclopetarius TaxID=280406 RepID=A0AAV2AVK3_9ARAC